MTQKIKVTYIYHSSFILECSGKTLLFDPPGRGFLPGDIWDTIEKQVKNKDLYVFISHGHGDHYSPRVFDLEAKYTQYIVPDDINYPNNAVVLSDEEIREVKDLHVRTFKSNDQGVAYLIKLHNRTIYFGGDLAKWDWPEWSKKKRRVHVKIFKKTLEHLRGLDIDIAFSNMDKRLKSWAGPVDFIDKVKPKYFVPIHTFGNEEWISDLIEADTPKETTIVQYYKPGDSITLNF
ncbi:MAG: MBL fold metallo-hydrolase [Thermoplasmata archaeon]